MAVFEDEELPIAMGRNGQNIKLASGVTNYVIDAVKKTDYEGAEDILYLDEINGISSKQIEILSKAEIHSADDFIKVDNSDIITLKGMGVKTVEKISKLVNNEIAKRNEESNNKSTDSNNNENLPQLEEVK